MTMRSILPDRYLLLLILLLLLTWGASERLRHLPQTQVTPRLYGFPSQIGGYHGVDIPMDLAYEIELNTDDSLFRRYTRSPAGTERILPDAPSAPKGGVGPIWLYIGYYGTKKGGRTGHNPYACYPASGWTILEKAELDLPSKADHISVPMLLIKKRRSRRLVAFWYQQRDVVLASGIRQNLHRFLNRIVHRKDEGAFVRVSIQISGRSLQPALARLRSFAGAIMSLLPRYWPLERPIAPPPPAAREVSAATGPLELD